MNCHAQVSTAGGGARRQKSLLLVAALLVVISASSFPGAAAGAAADGGYTDPTEGACSHTDETAAAGARCLLLTMAVLCGRPWSLTVAVLPDPRSDAPPRSSGRAPRSVRDAPHSRRQPALVFSCKCCCAGHLRVSPDGAGVAG